MSQIVKPSSGGGGGGSVNSVSAGTGITLTGTPTDPIVNAISGSSAFSVKLSTNIADVTGDNTQYHIPFDVVQFDNGGNYNAGTSNYVFPSTGIYMINILYFMYTSTGGGGTPNGMLGYALVNGVTNIRLVDADCQSLGLISNGEFMTSASFLYQATAGDTMGVYAQLYGSGLNTGVAGGTQSCYFSGYRVA